MMTIRSKPITDSYLKGIDQNLSLGDESALPRQGSWVYANNILTTSR